MVPAPDRVMSGHTPEDRDAVPHEEEAAIWFTRLRRHGVRAGEHAEFQAWLRADPRHAAAWSEIGGLWSALDGAEAELAAGLTAKTMRRRALWKPAAAATLAASAAGLWLAADPLLRADLRTAPGERRSLRLADGTAVELDAGTALSTELEGEIRQVRLLAGQAFFTVQPGAHPFAVLAGEGRTEAREARFGVSLLDDGARIATLDGVTEVRQAAGHVVLGQGEGAEYGAAGLRGPIVADLASLLAWRQGQMIFRSARLREVVRDLRRYRGGQILITDRSTGEILVSGAFSTREPDAVLTTIEQTLPVRIRYLAGYLVLISAA